MYRAIYVCGMLELIGFQSSQHVEENIFYQLCLIFYYLLYLIGFEILIYRIYHLAFEHPKINCQI